MSEPQSKPTALIGLSSRTQVTCYLILVIFVLVGCGFIVVAFDFHLDFDLNALGFGLLSLAELTFKSMRITLFRERISALPFYAVCSSERYGTRY